MQQTVVPFHRRAAMATTSSSRCCECSLNPCCLRRRPSAHATSPSMSKHTGGRRVRRWPAEHGGCGCVGGGGARRLAAPAAAAQEEALLATGIRGFHGHWRKGSDCYANAHCFMCDFECIRTLQAHTSYPLASPWPTVSAGAVAHGVPLPIAALVLLLAALVPVAADLLSKKLVRG